MLEGIIFMVSIFIAAVLVGSVIISKIPSLLHTPLMSGIMAMSGINIIGALVTTIFAAGTSNKILGAVAIVFCMINVVGGFLLTERMLRMFKHRTLR